LNTIHLFSSFIGSATYCFLNVDFTVRPHLCLSPKQSVPLMFCD
jgi:hypothetical protein